jgi:hypothetical protein
LELSQTVEENPGSTHAAFDAAAALKGAARCRSSERKRYMNTTEQQCVGFIQLVYSDTASNQVITLGGAGFITHAEASAAWVDVPRFTGETNLVADRLDANRDIIDDKPVSAETCERPTGTPIADLITAGRAALARELAGA